MNVTFDINELKNVINDAVESKLGAIHEEIENLSEKVSKDLKINYLSTMARALEREATQVVNGFECAYDVKSGMSCKSEVKRKIANYTHSLAVGDIANALTVIEKLHSDAKTNAYNDDKAQGCNRDWKEVNRFVSRHKELVKDLAASMTPNSVPADLGELEFDPSLLYTQIIFPFSHELRIKIIHTLKNGSKRFTALKNDLGVKNTGLLVHHLKPLTQAKIVVQDHRKQYSLSEKGYLVDRYLSQLSSALQPNEPIISMLQPMVVLQD